MQSIELLSPPAPPALFRVGTAKPAEILGCPYCPYWSYLILYIYKGNRRRGTGYIPSLSYSNKGGTGPGATSRDRIEFARFFGKPTWGQSRARVGTDQGRGAGTAVAIEATRPSYRYRRFAGRYRQTVRINRTLHPDPRAALETLVDPLRLFEVVAEAVATTGNDPGDDVAAPLSADALPANWRELRIRDASGDEPPRVYASVINCGSVPPPLFGLDDFFGIGTMPVEPIAVPDGLTIARRPAASVVYAHPPLDATEPSPPPSRGVPLWLALDADEVADAPPVDAAPSLPSFDEIVCEADLDIGFEPDRLEATRRWIAAARERHDARGVEGPQSGRLLGSLPGGSRS